ncbi:hypothetical protein [Streptomyces rubiginosohelvolus]
MAHTTGPARIQLAGRTIELAWLREHSTQVRRAVLGAGSIGANGSC